jgi:hypothetical protein
MCLTMTMTLMRMRMMEASLTSRSCRCVWHTWGVLGGGGRGGEGARGPCKGMEQCRAPSSCNPGPHRQLVSSDHKACDSDILVNQIR